MEQILNDINLQGYSVIENAIPSNLTQSLLLECHKMESSFTQAAIGRQQDTQKNTLIRSDKTLWLTGTIQQQKHYLELMELIRIQVNQHFFLGLFDYECHYARYEIGDFYKKHHDAFRGRSNRVFTTVCYLNTPKQGGELNIYCDQTGLIIKSVSPKSGTLVVFESERFPHEVLVATASRFSISGWFRKNNSVSGVLDPAS
jgi:SM-20-related protein